MLILKSIKNNNMKITFIGGSGFVGTRLIDILQEDSKNTYQLKNIDLQQSPFHP